MRKKATITKSTDTELVVDAPAGKAGETVDVRVVLTPGGESLLPKAFTYAKSKPKKKK